MVQMVSEQVVLELTGEEAVFPNLDCDAHYAEQEYCKIRGYEVLVSTSFEMRNQSSIEERMVVRFPLQLGPPFRNSIISDFVVMIGNQELDWQSIPIENEYGHNFEWAAFSVTFPANQTKTIKVSYSTLAYPFEKSYDRHIGYVLETGAGWFGPIEQGEIILHMPYQATRYNILDFPEGAEFSGRELLWSFENLEPTYIDNWQVDIVNPGLWQKVLEARERLDRNPDDVGALVELGTASTEASVEFHGFIEPEKAELFLEGVEAYKSATALAPDDVEVLVLYFQAISTVINNNESDWGINTSLPTRSEIMPLLQRLQDITGEEDLSSVSWEAQIVFDFYDPTLVPTMTIAATNIPANNIPISTQTKTLETPVAPSTLEDTAPAEPTATRTEITQQKTELQTGGWIWLFSIGIVILLGGGIIWRTRSTEEKTE